MAMESKRYSALIACLGAEAFERIRLSRVLVVGAGGIGCELLKNLVLCGFSNIDIVDLDTIDVSNLNRQFLFRKHHIGNSKAKVARDSALQFNPHVTINAHHGNIKDQDFGPSYFQQFNLVMNALDNLSARRHVNRLCLATNIPLIESGTAGYLGQVTVIRKGKTECFECQPTPAPKTYAVCTIRSNPTAPIHCVVWSLQLFKQLFGKADENESVVALDDKAPSSATPTATTAQESDEDRAERLRDEERLRLERETRGLAHFLFHKLFYVDIKKLANMKEMWKERSPPSPIEADQALATTGATAPVATGLRDQRVWELSECARVFLELVDKLSARRAEADAAAAAAGREGVGLEFDKDDDDALNFVTAVTNLRAEAFRIARQSRFDVKAMAGNIIPAIATTNAVIAGLIVIEAIKILTGSGEKPDVMSTTSTTGCPLATVEGRATYLLRKPSRKRLLLPTPLAEPNPQCYVCGHANFVTLRVDTAATTLGFFVESILRAALGMAMPAVYVCTDCVYEAGDDADEDDVDERAAAAARRARQEAKWLRDVRITDGSLVYLEDFSQNFKVEMAVVHVDNAAFPEEGPKFELIGSAKKKEGEGEEEERNAAAGSESLKQEQDDECIIVELPPTHAEAAPRGIAQESSRRKRKREGEDAQQHKRQKTEHNDATAGGNTLIVLD